MRAMSNGEDSFSGRESLVSGIASCVFAAGGYFFHSIYVGVRPLVSLDAVLTGCPALLIGALGLFAAIVRPASASGASSDHHAALIGGVLCAFGMTSGARQVLSMLW
jgi:hypothetical protein